MIYKMKYFRKVWRGGGGGEFTYGFREKWTTYFLEPRKCSLFQFSSIFPHMYLSRKSGTPSKINDNFFE